MTLPRTALAAAFAALLLAAPAQNLQGLADALAPKVAAKLPVVICAKGIELTTGEPNTFEPEEDPDAADG